MSLRESLVTICAKLLNSTNLGLMQCAGFVEFHMFIAGKVYITVRTHTIFLVYIFRYLNVCCFDIFFNKSLKNCLWFILEIIFDTWMVFNRLSNIFTFIYINYLTKRLIKVCQNVRRRDCFNCYIADIQDGCVGDGEGDSEDLSLLPVVLGQQGGEGGGEQGEQGGVAGSQGATGRHQEKVRRGSSQGGQKAG